MDGIFVEDFIDVGGPDFTYLPWPQTSPIIGGISEDSDYSNSIESIINSNPFTENEKFEKYFAHKAYHNDELGKSLGDTDIEQIRAFKVGTFDLNYLLGISNQMISPAGELNSYYNDSYWDGETNSFPKETSVGSLFIDDVTDTLTLSLTENSLFEFNCGEVNISHIIDSSGNGNKGILIGDYKITKDQKGVASMRDTVMKISKTDDKNGAI